MKTKLLLFALILTANMFAQSIPTYVLKSKKPLTVNLNNTINEQITDTVILVIDGWHIGSFQSYNFNYRYVSKDFSIVFLNKTFSATSTQVDSLYTLIKSSLPAITSFNTYLQYVGYAGAKVQAVGTFTNTILNDWELIQH